MTSFTFNFNNPHQAALLGSSRIQSLNWDAANYIEKSPVDSEHIAPPITSEILNEKSFYFSVNLLSERKLFLLN